jgi:predicted nucleic acid-binding protein
MRSPSRHIVIDANIIVASVLGAQTFQKLGSVARRRRLIVSEGALNEVRRVLRSLTWLTEPYFAVARDVEDGLSRVDEAEYRSRLAPAADILRNAPASRNGSIADAHILATAWLFDADIWSHDRDFAGSGWPTWSSANLLTAIADEA